MLINVIYEKCDFKYNLFKLYEYFKMRNCDSYWKIYKYEFGRTLFTKQKICRNIKLFKLTHYLNI